MCYRCEICGEVSKPGRAMLRYTVYRPRPVTLWNLSPGQEIEREVVVCPVCLHDLRTECLDDLLTAHLYTRAARLETERLRRAERKAAERERLRIPVPLLGSVNRRKTQPSPRPSVTTALAPPEVPVQPVRKLGRSVRSAK